MKTTKERAERIQLRVSKNEKRVLQEATHASKKSLSKFILEKSITEAEIALSGQTRFVLDGDKWSKFVELLERPARTKTSLKEVAERTEYFGKVEKMTVLSDGRPILQRVDIKALTWQGLLVNVDIETGKTAKKGFVR
jgi:uncharacterized protein (DUF1778 family)